MTESNTNTTGTNATSSAKSSANKMADEAQQNTAKMADEATKRFEENTERAKEFQSSMAESSKANSRAVVDNYEKAAKNFFEMQRDVVGSNRLEWMKNAAETQIRFAEEVTDAWVKAARNLLK